MKNRLLTAMAFLAALVLPSMVVIHEGSKDRQQDPSPVIHGSSDQTITPAPTPYSPRHKLPGYPISRLSKGTAK